MLEFLKQKNDRQPLDVKVIRNRLLQFIKEQLQRREGGEGNNIRGMELYIASPPQEKDVYESIVYFHDADRFKNEELQKIADDYAIALPSQWYLNLFFVDDLPVRRALYTEPCPPVFRAPMFSRPSVMVNTLLIQIRSLLRHDK